jgi:2Fe-2S ferredoxin
MTKIVFENHAGKRVAVEAKVGSTVMETAIANNIEGIVAECGGACACATCHVYVAPEWLAATGSPKPAERDMLEFADEVRENSRLSCQITITQALDGLVVQTPEKQS